MQTGIRCNWGAIFCGAFATLAVGILFLLLGNAIGISPIHVLDDRASDALRIGSGVYAGAAWVVAFFVGGLACTRVGRIEEESTRTLYGFLSWAVSGVLTLILAVQTSFIFRVVLTGEGSDAANWLMVSVAGAGALASAMGGRLGWKVPLATSPGVEAANLRELDREERGQETGHRGAA